MKFNHLAMRERGRRARRGSALMIALIVISIMTTLGLTGSRLVIMQFKNIRSFTQNIQAFYAAESGLEKGFLSYRANRNQEQKKALNLGATKLDYQVFFKGKDDLIPVVKQDKDYDVFTFGSGYNLKITWDKAGKVAIKKIVQAGTTALSLDVMPPRSVSPVSIAITGAVTRVRLHAFQDEIHNLRLSCPIDGCLARHKTIIDAQAVSGGTAKHLRAEISRQSGALASLFDYTLFSQQDIQ